MDELLIISFFALGAAYNTKAILYVIHHEHWEADSSMSLLLKEFEEWDAIGTGYRRRIVRHVIGLALLFWKGCHKGCIWQYQMID